VLSRLFFFVIIYLSLSLSLSLLIKACCFTVLDATFNIVLALDLEVDSSRFPTGFSVQKAVQRTLKVVTDLTDRVKLSGAAFPVVLRVLLRHVEKEVTQR
jgi:hypothetical protein